MTRIDFEEQEQIVLVRWVELQHPELFRWLHHSPNGGKRGAYVGAKMKKLGAKKGFIDLVGFLPRGDWGGIAIELKRPATPGRRKGQVTKDQLEWLNHFANIGWYTTICYGQDAARDTINQYMSLE